MKYRHNSICTTDGEVITGNIYCYKESSYIATVKVLDQGERDNGIFIKFEVMRVHIPHPTGRTFEVWAANGDYAYSGMWRLYDNGEYISGETK